jgi:hypothetical protein
MSHPKWYRRAYLFIYRQRAEELRKAIARYPNSERLQIRMEELSDIESKIEEFEEEEATEG